MAAARDGAAAARKKREQAIFISWKWTGKSVSFAFEARRKSVNRCSLVVKFRKVRHTQETHPGQQGGKKYCPSCFDCGQLAIFDACAVRGGWT
jgi:hypothetical protein